MGFGEQRAKGMIDNFALAVSHGLMLLAAWFLLRRPDLDKEPGPQESSPGPNNDTKAGDRRGA